MWRLCCVFVGRNDSKIIEAKRQSKLSADLLPGSAGAGPTTTIVTEPSSSGASQCCDDLTRPPRGRSSRAKSNGHTAAELFQNSLLAVVRGGGSVGGCCDQPPRRHSTPYFEVDLETGRRPTLVVETTAKLAIAESVDLEHSRRSSSISAPVYKPLGMSNRRKMTAPTQEPIEEPKRCAVETQETEPGSGSRRSSGRKRTGFIKLRAPGSSFRKRMMQRKGERTGGFPRLNFMSRGRGHKSDDLYEEEGPSGAGESCDLLAHLPSGRTVSPGASKASLNSSGKISGVTTSSRRDSLYIFSHSDEPIVTPFAQILASLRKVRSNFIYLTNVHSSKE